MHPPHKLYFATSLRFNIILTPYTGLRHCKCRELTRQQIALYGGILSIPMTKNGKHHRLTRSIGTMWD